MKSPREYGFQHAPADSVGTPEPGFWLTTFLFSIPFGFVVTLAGAAIAMAVSLARSGEAATAGDYGGALLSSIVIGLLIFVGFCYLIVPIAMVVLGLVRLTFRSVAARESNREVAK